MKTLITPEVFVVLNDFNLSFLVSKSLFVKVTCPVTSLNSALLILNFKSSFWSADQVTPFCDLKKTPVL